MEEIKDDHCELSLVKQTQQRILDYISHENYDFNSVLPKENEMSEILGVSRGVIREAYSSLRALGFIDSKRKRGTILVPPKVFGIIQPIITSGFLDERAMRDLYELRLMLEIGMADYVVLNNKDERRIAQLESIIQQEQNAEDPELISSLDIKFHTVLYSMSGNKSLQSFQRMLSKLFKLYSPSKPRVSKEWQKNEMMTHSTLLEILKMGNAEMFRSAMRIHLENQFRNQQKNLAKYKQNGLIRKVKNSDGTTS